jgi:hypothetical protein
VKVVEPKYDPPKDKINKQGKLFYALMLNDLSQSIERNQRIVKEIMELSELGRQMLILTDRREHIKTLQEMLNERQCKATMGTIIGGMKEKDQQDAMTKNIIFSTYPMCSEALDIPTLSIVVLATPKPDVRQAVARAMRIKSAAIQPLIVDILDRRSMWIRFWYSRLRFYKGEGYLIEFEGGAVGSTKEELEDAGIEIDMDDTNIATDSVSNIEMKRKREDGTVQPIVKKQKECPY